MEASIGIANVFKFFRVDLVKRLSYLNHPNVAEWGIRARFKFDFWLMYEYFKYAFAWQATADNIFYLKSICKAVNKNGINTKHGYYDWFLMNIVVAIIFILAQRRVIGEICPMLVGPGQWSFCGFVWHVGWTGSSYGKYEFKVWCFVWFGVRSLFGVGHFSGYLLLFGWTSLFLSSLFAFIGLIGSMMVSYVRARAEGLGIECKGGLMQRPERVVLLGVSALLCGIIGNYIEITNFYSRYPFQVFESISLLQSQ